MNQEMNEIQNTQEHDIRPVKGDSQKKIEPVSAEEEHTMSKDRPAGHKDHLDPCPCCLNEGKIMVTDCDLGTQYKLVCHQCKAVWYPSDHCAVIERLNSENEEALADYSLVMTMYNNDKSRKKPPQDLLYEIQMMFGTIVLLERNGRPVTRFAEQCLSLVKGWSEATWQWWKQTLECSSKNEALHMLHRLRNWVEGGDLEPDEFPF